jgi:EmrB/QacA subfamily drug resistance transporter
MTTADEGSLAALSARHGPRYRWMLLLAVMVGTMASVMSSTIVNVAIPDLSRHFTLGQDRAQWVTSGFMAAMTVSMLTTPWMLGRFGYRRTYAACMLLLLGGGVVGGLAQFYPLVLAARVAEGLAAGVVQPIPAIIILRAFGPDERGRASGIFGMGVVLAPAIGPSVGGLLVDWFGWRSIFFMVVPFCLASLWLGQRYVPVTAPGGVAAGREAGHLDVKGLVLVTLASLGLINALVHVRHGGPAEALVLGGLALACLGVFVWWQRRLAGRAHAHAATVQPLIPPALFAVRAFAMGNVVAVIYGTALFGSTYLIPVYLQMGLSMSASSVGLILLPAGLVLALTLALSGRMADRKPERMVTLGLLLLAASFALMVTLAPPPDAWVVAELVAWSVLGRVGLGMILSSLNLVALRDLHKGDIPAGASVVSFTRMLGGAVGVSLCGIVLEWRLAAHGATLVTQTAAGLPGDGRMAAFHETFLMLATLCVLAMLAARRMRAPHPTPSP